MRGKIAFTLDTLQTAVEKTLLNPMVMGTLYLSMRYYSDTPVGSSLLATLFCLILLGAVRWANEFLNDRVLNNWRDDCFDWKHELVLITGGSQGIGAQVVDQLAQRIIKVVIVDIQAPVSLAPTTSFYPCDLASAEGIAAVTAQIQAEHGHPTVLINNAGTINRTPILQTRDTQLTRIFATNILAPYRLLQAFLPSMVAANHGIVVTLTSVAGYVTPPGMVDYSMSKAAVVALHEGLSSELVSRYNAPRVRTICVVPNFVRTNLAKDFVYDSPFVSPMLEAEAVAKSIVGQLLTGRSGYVIIPKSAGWFGMLIRAWPWWMQRLLSISPSITEVTRRAELLSAETKMTG